MKQSPPGIVNRPMAVCAAMFAELNMAANAGLFEVALGCGRAGRRRRMGAEGLHLIG